MKKESLLFASMIGLGLSGLALAGSKPEWAKKGDTIVKCKGVAKKGKNDCGANGHACAGQAKVDNDPNEWVYVPSGLCEKIGGSVAKKVKVK
ncbi:DUF2282 domain-containing protein [Pseudobacteriovorax antillogorgiicola]|uniref:Uncharacterized membrane protein n=1 Tax=Pseudobacteriovorax antillogorgiicola TaxID=1513793 RepID=A0A1Y6CH32_9BACT|nr:DUF2282 domain-containing protein [Pseudobacteriovorax antillogorgiicola]TCS46987.1 putative membrane protein [Pseudobacteriovorax antillogorgiicola]SMF64860.1 Uncharacterized membrane protein [Pseudobacteriovorax antillogorgiicola]